MGPEPCDNYKERIEQYSCGGMNLHENGQLFEHIRQCDACKWYMDTLIRGEQDVEQLLDSIGELLDISCFPGERRQQKIKRYLYELLSEVKK